jgi:hypothetical protein
MRRGKPVSENLVEIRIRKIMKREIRTGEKRSKARENLV